MPEKIELTDIFALFDEEGDLLLIHVDEEVLLAEQQRAAEDGNTWRIVNATDAIKAEAVADFWDWLHGEGGGCNTFDACDRFKAQHKLVSLTEQLAAAGGPTKETTDV